jgi:uncharacterized protein (TIGR00266 family)
MEIRLDGNPDFGEATCALAPGEVLVCEGGAMSRMSAGMDLKTRAAGGVLKSLFRAAGAGESFFLSEYSSPEGGFVTVAPATPGAIVHRELRGEKLHLSAGSFLAASADISLDTRFGGLKALFSGEGAFVLDAEGEGELLFNAYGAIVERELDGELIVDTGHVVAWEPTLDYSIEGMGGLKQTFFSGEGLVMRFAGAGKLWLQTRTLGETAGWITPYLRA